MNLLAIISVRYSILKHDMPPLKSQNVKLYLVMGTGVEICHKMTNDKSLMTFKPACPKSNICILTQQRNNLDKDFPNCPLTCTHTLIVMLIYKCSDSVGLF